MSLPAHLEDALRAAPSGARAILLVRHAERGPIVDVVRHEEVLLTEAGHAAARAAGRSLAALCAGRRFDVRVSHSPVERCAETARGIAHGLRELAVEPTFTGQVAMLGPHYVLDRARGDVAARTHGHGYLRAWLDGDVPADVLHEKRAASRAQLRALVELVTAPGALHVMVTHDWNIALLREELLGLTHEAFGWPAFLDGMVIVVDGARVHLRNGAHDATIDLRGL